MAEQITARNGKAPPLPPGAEEWPTLTEAANMSGISRARLTEYIKRGALSKVLDPNGKGPAGSFRINPEELQLVEELEADEQTRREAPTTADVVRASVEAVKQATAHNERLITLFDGPYKFVLDTMREENAALRAELATMRTERAALQKLQEETRSAQALESLVLAEVQGDQNTKREAIDLAKKIIAPMALKHFGVVDPRAQALQDALAAIPRESFEVLFKMGVLPPEAEAKLKVGLDWKDPEPSPAHPPPEGPKE
jgi:hypothetical protein